MAKTKIHFKTDSGVLCKPHSEFDTKRRNASADWHKTEQYAEVTCAKCLKVFDGYKKI